MVFQPVLQDHLINDLSAKDAPPPEEFITDAIEFFKNHGSTATMALHSEPPKLNLLSITSNFHTKP